MLLIIQNAGIPFHGIKPEIFEWGWFVLRWYSLAYIAGLLLGWWHLMRLASRRNAPMSKVHADDFLLWAALGTILGGRLGYVLFYKPAYYVSNPGEIFQVWDGGMSFHGGLLGVTLAILLFARKNRIDVFKFADLIACVAPIGLFFGRIANFINGELWGAPSDLPWAMYFPSGGDVARHPSQLYEAFFEGAVLFIALNYMLQKTRAQDFPGMTVGTFWVGYGLFRFMLEYVRVPDAHLGHLWGAITMGQILSLPMIAFGAWLIARGVRVGNSRTAKG